MKLYLLLLIIGVLTLLIINSVIFFKLGKRKQHKLERGLNYGKMISLAESTKVSDNLWYNKNEGLVTGEDLIKMIMHTDPKKLHVEFVDQKGSVYFANDAVLDRYRNCLIFFDTHSDGYDLKGNPLDKGGFQ